MGCKGAVVFHRVCWHTCSCVFHQLTLQHKHTHVWSDSKRVSAGHCVCMRHTNTHTQRLSNGSWSLQVQRSSSSALLTLFAFLKWLNCLWLQSQLTIWNLWWNATHCVFQHVNIYAFARKWQRRLFFFFFFIRFILCAFQWIDSNDLFASSLKRLRKSPHDMLY